MFMKKNNYFHENNLGKDNSDDEKGELSFDY